MWSTGLVDDDFGMELLVSGAIIGLNLPVRLVWECIWRPSLTEDEAQGSQDSDGRGPASRGGIEIMGPPMVVTYRLQV